MCECSNLTSALFTLVAVHYVFDIEYCSQIKDLFHFFEDKLLEIRSGQTLKQSHTYLQTMAAVSCHMK